MPFFDSMTCLLGPFIRCGRSVFGGSRADPAQINIDENNEPADSSARMFPRGRWIDSSANPDARALQVIDAMQGARKGTIWLHLVKSSRIRPRTNADYNLWPIYWIRRANEIIGMTNNEEYTASKLLADEHEIIPTSGDDVFNVKSPVASDSHPESWVAFESPILDVGSNDEGHIDVKVGRTSRDNQCALCMDSVSNVSLSPCGHEEFCQMCILRIVCYWNRSEPPPCPLCRATIHTIFFSPDDPVVHLDSKSVTDSADRLLLMGATVEL